MKYLSDDSKHYLRRLLIIAVPIMLSNVISQLQMIIDRIFLGQMNTLYMSALGNVTSPMWTTMSFCFSLSMGASILISQNVGAGDRKKVEEYASSLILWNNIIPCMLFVFWLFCGKYVFSIMGVSDNIMPMCLSYTKYLSFCFLLVGMESSFSVVFQTSNYTKPLVMYGVIRSGLNVILDYILIFGHFGFPKLGIEGAAIATTIAEFAGCIFATFVVLGKKLDTKPSYSSIIKAPIKPYFNSIRLGINIALEDFAWNVGNLVMIRILNSINDLAAGIYSIVFSVEVLVIVIIGAIGNGTMTLTGEAKGCKNIRQYTQVIRIAYILSASVSLLTLIGCSIFPQSILSLFTKDENIVTGCGIYLILVCVNLFAKSANIIVGNGIRGYGNTKWMLGTQMFGTVLVITCACLFVFLFKLGMIGVFMAVLVDEFVRSIINFFKLKNIQRHWEE